MSKRINLLVDFKVDREKDKTAPLDLEIFRNYIGYAVNLGYKEGLTSDKRRLWDRIADKFDKAVEVKGEFVDLNAYEYPFIKTAFEKAVIPAQDRMFFIVEKAVIDDAAEVSE